MNLLSIFKKKEPATEAPVMFSKLEQAILDDLRVNTGDWRCSINGKDTKTCYATNVKRGVRFEVVMTTKYIGPSSDDMLIARYSVSVAGAHPFGYNFEHVFGKDVVVLAQSASEAEEARRKKDVLAQVEKAFVS